MATVLELAREVRQLIVNRSTGRFDITFEDHLTSVDFSDGTIVTSEQVFFPCFKEESLDYSFRTMTVPPPDEHQSGAALLIEAMESIDFASLQRVWEPYREWTILFPQDPDIHNTAVQDHRDKGEGRLRRLMRFAVSGVVTLEPPTAKTVEEEIAEIRSATERGDYWQVLGVTRTATAAEIKHAYRKKARKFHPDRWHNTTDLVLKKRVEATFRDVNDCYRQALDLAPRRLPPSTEPEPPAVKPTVVEKKAAPPTPAARKTAPTAEKKVAQYVAFDKKTADQGPQSIFRKIFDKVFKAA